MNPIVGIPMNLPTIDWATAKSPYGEESRPVLLRWRPIGSFAVVDASGITLDYR
jgi:hypothetical protein